MRHGAKEPFFGVKIADLKTIVKKVKKDHNLALRLYDSGNSDAMYLAGLIADETKMTKTLLKKWVKKAYWYMLTENTVADLAAETQYGFELAREWMKSPKEEIATAGWATFCSLVAIRQDSDLDINELRGFLKHIKATIHQQQNRVRYCMNAFVISCGSYVSELTPLAEKVAKAIGPVQVDMGGTSCKVPLADEYIRKVIQKGKHGKKRKTTRC